MNCLEARRASFVEALLVLGLDVVEQAFAVEPRAAEDAGGVAL